MARIHGKTGRVTMDPAGGSSLVTVADLNAWTLNASKDKVDVTCFGDTNKQKVVGLPDFSGTIGGMWNSASSPAFFDAVFGNVAVKLRLIPNSDELTYYFEGLAYLDGSLNVAANGAVTIGSTWDAANNWVAQP